MTDKEIRQTIEEYASLVSNLEYKTKQQEQIIKNLSKHVTDKEVLKGIGMVIPYDEIDQLAKEHDSYIERLEAQNKDMLVLLEDCVNALDSLLGDTDLDEDDSYGYRTMQRVSIFLNEAKND